MKPTVPESLRKFYEDVAAHREAALSELETHFTNDIHFRDPFRETRGIEAFRKLFDRMFCQYRHVAFSNFVVRGDDESFVLTYEMHLRMILGPTFTTHMMSWGRARDGRIYELTDAFDFTSALVSPVPLVGTLYRRFVNALFL